MAVPLATARSGTTNTGFPAASSVSSNMPCELKTEQTPKEEKI
jgi:hypothetical protein